MKGSLKIWAVILSMVVMGTGITLCTNSYVSHQIEKMAAEAGEEAEGEEAAPMEAAAGQAEDGPAHQAMPRSALTETGALGRAEVLTEADTDIREKKEVLVQEEPEPAAEEAVQETAVVLEQEDTGDDSEVSSDPVTGADGGVSMAMGAVPADANTAGAAVEIVECPADLQEALREYRERLPQIDAQIEQMRRSETENNNMYSVKIAAQTEQQIWEREMEGIYRLLCDSLEDADCQVLKKEQQEWLGLRDIRAEEAAKKNSGGSLESVDYIASIAASNRERAYGLLEKYQK